MKRALVLCSVLLMMTSVAFADDAAAGAKSLSVRTFTLKYKDVDKAAAMIKPLMTGEGSISMQPSTNALVVTDRPENLKTITKALTEFDVPPQAYRIIVRLVAASRCDAAVRGSDDTKDIAPKLAMLGFNCLEDLGSADVTGREGDPGIVTLPSGYRTDFKFGEYDPPSDSITVSDLSVSKLKDTELTQLSKKATLNLRLGQTYIIGATKTAKSQRALMIVLVARK